MHFHEHLRRFGLWDVEFADCQVVYAIELPGTPISTGRSLSHPHAAPTFGRKYWRALFGIGPLRATAEPAGRSIFVIVSSLVLRNSD